MKNEPEKKLHLVLGSGGVRCISYVGAIKALVEEGWSFASVSGCSAGSFVAAVVCAGLTPAEIENKILNLDLTQFAGRKRLFGLGVLMGWPFATYHRSGFPNMLRELIGS